MSSSDFLDLGVALVIVIELCMRLLRGPTVLDSWALRIQPERLMKNKTKTLVI